MRKTLLKLKSIAYILASKSKSSLSNDLELDRQNFHAWEKLDITRGPSIYSINRVCKSFNISLNEFFDSEIFR